MLDTFTEAYYNDLRVPRKMMRNLRDRRNVRVILHELYDTLHAYH